MSANFTSALVLVSMSLAASPALAGEKPAKALRVVEDFDLDRYMGRWCEVARYPNSYQRGAVAVEAHYELTDEGTIRVTNTARKRSLDGDKVKSTALAWPVENQPAQRRVRFVWPFTAPYWIIDLDEDYQWAVVGQPSRKHLWILCRQPHMPDDVYQGICKRLREQDYDPARLVRTPQPKADP